MSSALLRAAYAYDRLRAHPPEVAGQIATAMASAVHPKGEEPVFLELGVGTGRIALPLIARGYRYIALDADAAMLEVFRQKIAGVDRKVQVVQADARAIPLPDESVHGVIVVHLWHLVPDWPKVLAEAIRVLKPGGALLEGWDQAAASPEWTLQERWRAFAAISWSFLCIQAVSARSSGAGSVPRSCLTSAAATASAPWASRTDLATARSSSVGSATSAPTSVTRRS